MFYVFSNLQSWKRWEGGGQPSDKPRVNVGGILTINTMLILLDSEESMYKRKITCMSLFP